MNRIAGIVYPSVHQVNNLIQPMMDVMQHRCKNPPLFHTFDHIQLGACASNLSELDHIVAGLDGSITNAKEICLELNLNLESFAHNPAKLLCHAYQSWGNHFLERTKGNFALFILNKESQEILIARDRIGRKPLYWFYDDQYFVFGSEIKAILASGIVPQTIAPDAIASYLYFGYLPQDITLIKGLNKLLPSHYMLFNIDRNETIQSYWSYSSFLLQSKNEKKEDIVRNVDQLLLDSVKRCLSQEKPVGCLMTGLGSSTIACYLRELISPEEIKAFKVNFQGETTFEKDAAIEVSNTLEIKNLCSIISPENFLDDLVKIVWHLDEPIADPDIIAAWRLSTIASNVKFFFSSMGCDELLAGHYRYMIEERTAAFHNRLIQTIMPLLKRFLIPFLTRFYKPAAYHILKQARTNPWQVNFLEKNALFPDKVRFEAAPAIAGLFDPIVFLHKFHNLPEISSIVSSFIYLDVKTKLPDYFLMQYEKLMSVNGATWQTPFLDETLIEYLASIRDPDKIDENDPYFLLKSVLKNSLPKSVFNKPKKTQRHFLEAWSDTPQLSELFSLLTQGSLVETGVISKKWIESQLASPAKKNESFRLLWSLLILEIWIRLFINQPISKQPPEVSAKEIMNESGSP